MMTLNQFRLQRLADAAKQAGADMLIATHPSNIAYTANGFISAGQSVLTSAEAAVAYVPATGKVIFLMGYADAPSVFEAAGIDAEFYCYGGAFCFEGSGEEAFTERVLEYRNKAYANSAKAWEAAIRDHVAVGGTVAIDDGRVFAHVLDGIKAGITDYNLIEGAPVFMAARRIKHSEEIAAIETAAEIASNSLMGALKRFKVGMSEYDIEQLYYEELAKRHAKPFFFTVTGGLRAAFSDTMPTKAPIARGDMIRFDFGCIYEGYCSDLARTAVVGTPDKKLKTYFEAVRIGCETAIAAMKPGVPCNKIFEIAVETTRANGIPHYRRHHTGHGIGLECYDAPTINAYCDVLLEKDMTFCIETPYYEIGWGGVQMENTVVITENGARYLDKTQCELIVL